MLDQTLLLHHPMFVGDLLASTAEDSALVTEPSASTQTPTTNSTFAAAANSLVQQPLNSASTNGRKQPQTNFFPSKTQPHGAVLQGPPSANNVATQVAWPIAQPGVLALRNPVVPAQTQLPPPNNTKLRSQLLQQQQLNQQMALLQLQLSRMPPPIANIRLQIAHFQLLGQQLLQQQQQLKGMVLTPQVVAQQQQVTQQLFQVNQIIQHLQQQLVVALKQHPNSLKGVALAPGINPTLAHQAAIQGLLAAGQPVGGVNSAMPLKPVSGPVVSSGWTVPQQPGLLPTQLSLPQKDSRSSVGAVMENTATTAAAKALPNRSSSVPSAPAVAESNSKRTLPKIDARFFPDTIPEFQPGKPWQPRPKPTEPAQVYGNGTSTAPVLDASPTKANTSTASNSSAMQPKKLSAEARPFTLQKWGAVAKTEETEAPKRSESSSSSTSSEPSPATQASQTTKRPQQLTFADDGILGPSVPSYGLSKTPLLSMWSVSSQQKASNQFSDTSKSAQASDDASGMHTPLPSKEEVVDPLLTPPPSDKAHMKDVPGTGLWNHEGLAHGKVHSPEPSFAEWQAGKKAHLTVFKLPTNPPSAWLLVQGLPVGVSGMHLTNTMVFFSVKTVFLH